MLFIHNFHREVIIETFLRKLDIVIIVGTSSFDAVGAVERLRRMTTMKAEWILFDKKRIKD